MLQEIAALTIVFAAAVYTLVNSYRFFIGTSKSGCASGCSSCELKSEILSNIKNKQIERSKLTFNPKDLQVN